MTLKWKFFRLLNYVVGFFYLLKLISLISFATSDSVTQNDIFNLSLFIFITLAILLICYFNLYLLKAHFPDKIINGHAKNLHIASMIMFPICFFIEGMFFFNGIEDIRSEQNEKGLGVLQFTWLFFIILASIIMVGQLYLRKTLRTNCDRKQFELIDDLGN